MKARVRKKIIRRAAKRSQDLVDEVRPLATKATKVASDASSATMSSLAGGAATIASLVGSVMAIAKSDFVHDILDEAKRFRRKDTSAATLVGVGAGVAIVAGGAAYLLGTERGRKLTGEIEQLAKPYLDRAKPYMDRAKDAAHNVQETVQHGLSFNTSSHVNGASAPS